MLLGSITLGKFSVINKIVESSEYHSIFQNGLLRYRFDIEVFNEPETSESDYRTKCE